MVHRILMWGASWDGVSAWVIVVRGVLRHKVCGVQVGHLRIVPVCVQVVHGGGQVGHPDIVLGVSG